MLAERAKILLLAADGAPNAEVADRVGVTRQTVTSFDAPVPEGELTGRL